MSVSYSIDITLDLFYSENNIKYILTKGVKGGFIYFDDDLLNRLSIEKAVQKILYTDPESGDRCVSTKFQDTFFFIWFFKSDNGLLIFSIGAFGYRWDRDFSNGFRRYTIDFARYIKLMFQICDDLTFLQLETFTDELDEIIYHNTNCVMAAIDIGSFGEQNVIYDAKSGIRSFLCNAIQNDIIFFDEYSEKQIDPSLQKYYDILKATFPVHLYAKKDDVPFKIEIKRNEQSYDLVSVFPLEPYRMKKGYGSEEEKMDIAFYVERLLELCENFAIYELKTFI